MLTLNQKLRRSAQNSYTGQGKPKAGKTPDMRIAVKRYAYGLFLDYSPRSGHGKALGELGLPLDGRGLRYVPNAVLVDGEMPEGPAREYVKKYFDPARGVRG